MSQENDVSQPTTTLSEEQLEKLEELLPKISAGPWKWWHDDEGQWVRQGNPTAIDVGHVVAGPQLTHWDSVFIARLRNLAPSFIAEVRRLRVENERIREFVADYDEVNVKCGQYFNFRKEILDFIDSFSSKPECCYPCQAAEMRRPYTCPSTGRSYGRIPPVIEQQDKSFDNFSQVLHIMEEWGFHDEEECDGPEDVFDELNQVFCMAKAWQGLHGSPVEQQELEDQIIRELRTWVDSGETYAVVPALVRLLGGRSVEQQEPKVVKSLQQEFRGILRQALDEFVENGGDAGELANERRNTRHKFVCSLAERLAVAVSLPPIEELGNPDGLDDMTLDADGT